MPDCVSLKAITIQDFTMHELELLSRITKTSQTLQPKRMLENANWQVMPGWQCLSHVTALWQCPSDHLHALIGRVRRLCQPMGSYMHGWRSSLACQMNGSNTAASTRRNAAQPMHSTVLACILLGLAP